MLAFPSMLLAAARSAGMKTPLDADFEEGNYVFIDENGEKKGKDEYPHFFVFCALQLARPITYYTEPSENAKAIAAIPEDRLKTMTVNDFIEAGVVGLS